MVCKNMNFSEDFEILFQDIGEVVKSWNKKNNLEISNSITYELGSGIGHLFSIFKEQYEEIL